MTIRLDTRWRSGGLGAVINARAVFSSASGRAHGFSPRGRALLRLYHLRHRARTWLLAVILALSGALSLICVLVRSLRACLIFLFLRLANRALRFRPFR